MAGTGPFTAPTTGTGRPLIGLYLNKSKTGNAGLHDEMWLGDTAKEDELLDWCQQHGINYITMYDIEHFSSDSSQITYNTLPAGGGDLAAFIYKAKHDYGIQEVGVVGDLYRSSYLNAVVTNSRDVFRVEDYNTNLISPSQDPEQRIDWITQETEAWWNLNAMASDLIDPMTEFPTLIVGSYNGAPNAYYFELTSATDISYSASISSEYVIRESAHNSWSSGAAPDPVIVNNWTVLFYKSGVLRFVRQVVQSIYSSGGNQYRVDIPFTVTSDATYTIKIINTNEGGYKTGIWKNTVSEESYYQRCAAIKALCDTYSIKYELYLGWFEETTSGPYSTLYGAVTPVKIIKDLTDLHFHRIMPHCYINGAPRYSQYKSRIQLIANGLASTGLIETELVPIISLESNFSACWMEGRPNGCIIPQTSGCCPGVIPHSLLDGYEWLSINRLADGGPSTYYNNDGSVNVKAWLEPTGVIYFSQTKARKLTLNVGVPNSGACQQYPEPSTSGMIVFKNGQIIQDIKLNGVSQPAMVSAGAMTYDETGTCDAESNPVFEVIFKNTTEAVVAIDNVWGPGTPGNDNPEYGFPCLDDPLGNATITSYHNGPIAFNEEYSVFIEIARPATCTTAEPFRLFIYPWAWQYSSSPIDINVPGTYTFINNEFTLAPTTTAYAIAQNGTQAQTIQVTNDSCVDHDYDIVNTNCTDFTFTQVSLDGGGVMDIGGNPLRFRLTPGETIDISVSFTSAVVGAGTCTYDIVSELGLDCEKRRIGRNNYTVTGEPVQCFSNDEMFLCCDDIYITEDLGGTQEVACATVNSPYYINVNPIFPLIGAPDNCAGTLTVVVTNDITEVSNSTVVLAEDITYGSKPYVQIPWTPTEFGSYTIEVLMENDCSDPVNCSINVSVCEEYSWSKEECHKYLFVVPVPVAGRINTITVENKTDASVAIATYTVNNDDIDRVEIPLTPDGIYIITITDNLSTIVEERVVYEFCDLIECLKKLILDVLCDKYDPCCKDCNEITKAENNEKRYHINRVVALYSVLAGYMFKEKVKYFDVFSIDEERMIGINEISNIMTIINDITKTCGEC